MKRHDPEERDLFILQLADGIKEIVTLEAGDQYDGVLFGTALQYLSHGWQEGLCTDTGIDTGQRLVDGIVMSAAGTGRNTYRLFRDQVTAVGNQRNRDASNQKNGISKNKKNCWENRENYLTNIYFCGII